MTRSVAVETSSQETTVVNRVVAAVAELTGSDPLSLEPLHEVIDPEALDALFEHDTIAGADGTPNRVQFTYCDCEVSIDADGAVRASKSDREVTEANAPVHCQ